MSIKPLPNDINNAVKTLKGGQGSGNWGHGGLEGVWGGSSPKKGFGVMTADVDSYTKIQTSYMNKIASALSSEGKRMAEAAGYSSDTYGISRGVKAYICEDIAKAAGVKEYEVNEYLASWANTSNEDMLSYEIQKSISEQFGVPLSDWQKEIGMKYEIKYKVEEELMPKLIDVISDPENPNMEREIGKLTREFNSRLGEKYGKVHVKLSGAGGGHNRFFVRMAYPSWAEGITLVDKLLDVYSINDSYESQIEELRWDNEMVIKARQKRFDTNKKINKAIYESTQKKLKDIFGMSHFYLFRGVGSGDTVKNPYRGNTIESWSSNQHIGEFFKGPMGSLLLTKVPIQNIFSTCITGMGCFSEREFVIFGNTPGNHSVYDYSYNLVGALRGIVDL